MFATMNFLLGYLLAKDLDNNNDKVMCGLLAAQFPKGNLVGPVLMKPTLVDKATALATQQKTVNDLQTKMNNFQTKIVQLQTSLADVGVKDQATFVAKINDPAVVAILPQIGTTLLYPAA